MRYLRDERQHKIKGIDEKTLIFIDSQELHSIYCRMISTKK